MIWQTNTKALPSLRLSWIQTICLTTTPAFLLLVPIMTRRKTAEAKQIIQSKAYWNYEGNYTQSGKGWERQATMDYIDPSTGNVEFSAPMGVRLHGGASRMYGQKSFKFYMREEYGQKNLKYALIPGDVDKDGKQIKKYKGFMLRNGGNDTELTKIRDVFIQSCITDRAYGHTGRPPMCSLPERRILGALQPDGTLQ